MTDLISRLKRWWRGVTIEDIPAPPVPDDIREASHNLNNATSVLEGAARVLKREAGALEELARQMQQRRR